MRRMFSLENNANCYEAQAFRFGCYDCALSGCHIANGPDDVDLRTYATLQKGGEHGPLFLVGNAHESELVEEIVKRKMPPDGPYLEAEQIQLIIDWINAGAKDN